MATTAERVRSRPVEPDDELPRWKERLLPRTVLGMTVVLLAAAVGAAFSGTVLYAYYEYRLNQNEERIASFVEGFDDRFQTAIDTINSESESARADIRNELKPLQEIAAEGNTLKSLGQAVQPSVWFVATQDEAGQPSVGTAFVIASDDDQSILLTSWNTVRAASRTPGPAITVRKGEETLKVTLWTWQEERDLALLVTTKGNIPKLKVAPRDPPLEVGTRIFAASGLGAGGVSVTQGFVSDVSSAGIQHDAQIGPAFQGGPLLNSKGEVLGIASRAYAPVGFATDSMWFAVPVRAACEKVLRCPDGDIGGAGQGDER
ncbi:MAG: trypsin-like peptidase domain-containing protein [Acidimicrobiia bacterium]